jgi:hypothetical protein
MMPPSVFAFPSPDPSWIESLKRRKAIVERMCGALRDYLCLDIEESLSRAASAKPFAPTMEDLNQAQQKRESIQGQIDALKRLCDELPDANGEFLRLSQLPMLEEQLHSAEAFLGHIQKVMESSPSIEYYILACLACAVRFEPLVATSKSELLDPDWGAMLSACGESKTESFRQFYVRHSVHSLDAIPVGSKGVSAQ